MKSAKATRWSREAILALGNIIAHDVDGSAGDGQSGTAGGTGQANTDTKDKSEDDDGGADDDSDDDKDGDDAATLRKKLQNRREQAARQDAELKRLKAVEKEADELRKAKEETDRKGRSELENLKADLEAKDKALAAKDDTIRRLAVENAFMTLKGIQWNNPATALRLVDLSDVEFDQESGKPKDMKQLQEAAKALAKSDPYLVKSKTAVDDDTPNGVKSGQPPVVKKGDKVDDAALMGKYNIHR